MPAILRSLRLNRCDLVDEPANPKARVVFYKRATDAPVVVQSTPPAEDVVQRSPLSPHTQQQESLMDNEGRFFTFNQILVGTGRTSKSLDWACIYLRSLGHVECTKDDGRNSRYLRYRYVDQSKGEDE